jgi:hypothetical protein
VIGTMACGFALANAGHDARCCVRPAIWSSPAKAETSHPEPPAGPAPRRFWPCPRPSFCPSCWSRTLQLNSGGS